MFIYTTLGNANGYNCWQYLKYVSGVFAIIGCILFATDSDIKTLGEGMNLHAGFALCIIGGVASLAAGGVYLIASPSAL